MSNRNAWLGLETPEQARHDEQDPRADLAWLGLMTDPADEDEAGPGHDYFNRGVDQRNRLEPMGPRPWRSRSLSKPTHWMARLAVLVGVSTIVSLAVYLG